MRSELKPYPKYRDSGLPWLGKVPEHWSSERGKWLFSKQNRPVRDNDEVVTCFRDGKVTLRKNRRLRGFTEAIREFGYQGIRKGDLVIHAMDAFAGAVGVSDSDGKGSPVYSVCKPKEGINASYYAYLIREMARSKWIVALSKGIRERSTDFRYDIFGSQRILLPPPSEQAAIAKYLAHATAKIDAAIVAKKKVIALLEEEKRAIIQDAVTKGLDPKVKMKDSGVPGIGFIPEHWRTPLSCFVFREKIRKYNTNEDLELLSLSQKDGLIKTYEMKERSLKAACHDNWKIVTPGDLVLNRFKAHLGVFFSSSLRGIVSFHYGVYAPAPGVDAQYFEYLYHTSPYCTLFAGKSNGMTVGLQNLSNQNFYSVRSLLPPEDEQRQITFSIADKTQALSRGINRAENEISLLREYRTRLVADVVTGKLDVRKAAEGLPEIDETPAATLAGDEELESEEGEEAET